MVITAILRLDGRPTDEELHATLARLVEHKRVAISKAFDVEHLKEAAHRRTLTSTTY